MRLIEQYYCDVHRTVSNGNKLFEGGVAKVSQWGGVGTRKLFRILGITSEATIWAKMPQPFCTSVRQIAYT